MRLGINIPFVDGNGVPLDVTGVGKRARMADSRRPWDLQVTTNA